MKKIGPFIRILRLVQFIKQNNINKVKVTRDSVIIYLSKIFPEIDIDNQLFDRDKKRIRTELGIDLKHTIKDGYYIDNSEQENLIETSLDYYEMFSVLNKANALPEMFLISDRKPKGLNQISQVVSYIKDKQVIQFRYNKYDSNQEQIRVIEPLAIKESRERWYLIGNDFTKDTGLRSFSFDRISDITSNQEKFTPKYTIDEIKSKYQFLFAMFDAEDQEIEEIELKFDERDGNYINSFPIHHSQTMTKIENGYLVHLKLKITLDFIMEIMSRAWSLEVIKPLSLRQEIFKITKEANKRNR